MKTPYFSYALAAFLLVTGVGCSSNSFSAVSAPSTSTTPSLLSPTSSEANTTDPDFFTLHDNHGVLAVQLLKYPLTEINRTEIHLPDYEESDLKGAAVRYYRAGKDVFFALTQHFGSMSLPTVSHDTPLSTGIWYASSVTGGHWKPYLEIAKRHSDEIQNNPFNFWTDKKGVNLLTIDYNGGGSGEGIAKVLSSEDGGINWVTTKCFYYTPETFPEIFDNDLKKRENFSSYLDKKLSDRHVQSYLYNAKHNQYEFTQQNKETGNMEVSSEEACQDILPNPHGITARDFENGSPIPKGATETNFDVSINETEPVFHIRLQSFSSTTDAQISISRGDKNEGSNTYQIIALPSKLWSYQWRSEDIGSMFTLRDVNFDGYADIGISVDGGAKWSSEQYWLFDPKTKKFISSALTADLRKVVHNEIRFDTSTEHIITNNFIGPLIGKKTVYAIQNGRLKMIEDDEQETVYKNDEPQKECTVTTKKYIHGSYTTTHETLNEECPGYYGKI